MSQELKRLNLFCDVDDFCLIFIPLWNMTLLQHGVIKRVREPGLSVSEMMTIIIHFHQSHYRDFKTYYIEYVCEYLGAEFPNLVSYNRFVELMPRLLLPLCCYLHDRKGQVTGISFIDSTRITVCGNKRISRNQVFKDVAKLDKSSMVWHFGRPKPKITPSLQPAVQSPGKHPKTSVADALSIPAARHQSSIGPGF